MRFVIGLCLLLVQVWAGDNDASKSTKKVPSLMDDASFVNKNKASWTCSKELFIEGYVIKTTGGDASSNGFQIISVLCGTGEKSYLDIDSPRLEIRIYKKGTLITKYSKQYPEGKRSANNVATKQDRGRGRGMGNMFSPRTPQTEIDSGVVRRTVSHAVTKFKDLVPEKVVLNAISIESSEAEKSFTIYFKKSFYEPTILDKKDTSKTDCFQVKIFVLQKDPKEANVIGSVLNNFLGRRSGGGAGGADSASMDMMQFVESLPQPAESNKCPAGDVPTTSTGNESEQESEQAAEAGNKEDE